MIQGVFCCSLGLGHFLECMYINHKCSNLLWPLPSSLCLFLIINVHLLKILISNLIIFVPKVLRIIFLPLITSLPRSKTQKWTKEAYFLGHPVEKCEILKTLVLWWLSTPCWVGRHHGNDTHHEWENGINKNFRKGMTIVIAHSHQCGDSDSYCNKRRKNTIKRA